MKGKNLKLDRCSRDTMAKAGRKFFILTLILVAIIAQMLLNRVIALNGFSSFFTKAGASLIGILGYLIISAFIFGILALVLRIFRRFLGVSQEAAFVLCGGIVVGLIFGLTIAQNIGPYLVGDRYAWPNYLIYLCFLFACFFVASILFYSVGKLIFQINIFRIFVLVGLLVWIVLFANGVTYDFTLDRSTRGSSSDIISAGDNINANNGKVLLLGIDGLDWRILGKLFAVDELPKLRELINRGVSGDIVPVHYDSPIVWTTIATGKMYTDHGVLYFHGYELPFSQELLVFYPSRELVYSEILVYLAKAGLVREVPVRVVERREPALWNILSAAGKKVAVINWWPSYPAERVNGLYVSSYALRWEPDLKEALEQPNEDIVYPESLMEVVKSAFLKVKDEYQAMDPKVQKDLMWGRIAEEILDIDQNLDFVAFYLHTTDTASHVWKRALHHGRGAGVPTSLERKAWNALLESYRRVDHIIGRILEHIDEKWTVVVVSDHGWNFHLFSTTHHGIPTPEGVIIIFGAQISPPVPRDIPKSSSLDITPTVLALLGVPVSKRMPGKVVIDGLRNRVRYVNEYQLGQYWSDKESRSESKTVNEATKEAEKELLEHLKSLGYFE